MKRIVRHMAIITIPLLGLFFQLPAWSESSWLNQGSKLLKSMTTDQGSDTVTSLSSGLATEDIIAGLKQALEKGSSAVVNQLGASDGFNTDQAIHIPLPEKLAKVKALLDKAGMGSYADTVELKLNRAAEAATPKAKALFKDAITQMSFQDAKKILNGPDDAATQYFKSKMSPELTQSITPVVDKSLNDVGAIQSYDQMIGAYKKMPFVPDVKGNLTAYTVQKTMDGIFYYLAKEEKAIRENPAKRTTALLKKVFK
ncbi:MAG: hypothetical protein CSA29_02875 [Desulfobacterales bacterium]|nr:MAG: hypothetical protein CSA29_02875 [Desulfobacterales bacterium]